jgi:hypothetical protein
VVVTHIWFSVSMGAMYH